MPNVPPGKENISADTSLLEQAAKEGLISADDVERILEEARRSGLTPELVLWDFPELDVEKLLKLKSAITGVKPYQLEPGAQVPAEVLKIIPEEVAERYQAVPLSVREDVLEFGMFNPNDVLAEEAIRFIASRRNLRTKKWLIGAKDLKSVLGQYRTLRGEVVEALGELEEELKEERPPGVALEAEPPRLIEEAPLIKIVAVILKYATEGRASDIHIEPLLNAKKTRVRFRLDGALHTSLFVPGEVHGGIVSRIKVLSDMKIDETRIPQDGRFRAAVDERPIDFRVSTFPQVGGEKVVMRILDPTIGLKSLEDLGLVGHNLEVVKRSLAKSFGMVLITGPTGSGKSTTLNAVLRILNEETDNIVTLEDPVEYYLEGISQSEIKADIGYTFASGLRHILRQDPDIIMVGEIRDLETAGLAVHAALTGHLLFSTLHTNNAIGVIPRLVDMKLEPFLVAATLTAAIAQRLIRRLCPFCKVEEPLPKAMQSAVEKALADSPATEAKRLEALTEKKFYRAAGCKHCAMKGTRGRLAVYEALEMTPELQEIVVKGAVETEVVKEARRQGMVTMRLDGILKAMEGLVSLQEVLEAVE